MAPFVRSLAHASHRSSTFIPAPVYQSTYFIQGFEQSRRCAQIGQPKAGPS
jgi:hypothetical protein